MQMDVETRVEERPTGSPVADHPVAEPERPGRKGPLSEVAVFLHRARVIVPVAVVGMFVLALVAFLYFGKAFVMPIVIALLLTFLLKPVVRMLHHIRVPEMLGAIIVIAVFFSGLFFAVSRLVQPASEWVARAPETLNVIEYRFQDLIHRAQRITRAAAEVESITKEATGEAAPKVEVKEPVLINTVVTFTKSFVAGLIETIVLLFFMLAPGDLFMQKLVRVMPTLHDKKKAVEIATELQHNLSAFLFTITVINAMLGVAVGFATHLLGLPNPVLWGVLAGVLNFIPYFGPITGVAVLTLAGLIAFESPWRAVLPALVYLGLHGLESNVVTPMILGRRLTLNPLVIFISLMFWTWLWGIPGALLSIPMLMMAKVLCDHFKPLTPVGEFLSG